MLWCKREQLEIAISIVDCAADFYNATKRIMFVSIINLLINIVIFAFTLGAVFYIFSLSHFTFSTDALFDGHFLGEPHISGA